MYHVFVTLFLFTLQSKRWWDWRVLSKEICWDFWCGRKVWRGRGDVWWNYTARITPWCEVSTQLVVIHVEFKMFPIFLSLYVLVNHFWHIKLQGHYLKNLFRRNIQFLTWPLHITNMIHTWKNYGKILNSIVFGTKWPCFQKCGLGCQWEIKWRNINVTS